ncbi:Transposase [Caenorhabditis elegans]|uniref:Transposase n=1 Tax=Caenorhabditis elegans TaxID=6239 RepID=O61740_CAEEL|nr:Transposase [Caenorhabditis elegans]CCD61300.2 Transposase [Caenorhabditis elegans]
MLNERMIEHVKSKLTKRGVKVWDKLASRVSFL